MVSIDMNAPNRTATVREAVGIFVEPDHLQSAMAELLDSGFEHKRMGLLAAEGTVRESLSDFYAEVAESGQDEPGGTKTAFVEKESVGDAARSGGGGLFFAGATAAAGVAVASAGVLGGALLAAVTGVGAVGAIGVGLAMLIRQSDAEYLEEQVEGGRLLLFVRTHGASQEKRAKEILSKHQALEVRMCTPVDSG